MLKSTFEDEIACNGFLLYRNVGDSMLPLIRQGKDLLSCDDQAAPGLFRYPIDGDERQAAMLTDRAALTACQVDDGYDVAGMDGEITAQMEIHGRPSFCIWQRGSR